MIPASMWRQLAIVTSNTELFDVTNDDLWMRSGTRAIVSAFAILRKHVSDGVALPITVVRFPTMRFCILIECEPLPPY